MDKTTRFEHSFPSDGDDKATIVAWAQSLPEHAVWHEDYGETCARWTRPETEEERTRREEDEARRAAFDASPQGQALRAQREKDRLNAATVLFKRDDIVNDNTPMIIKRVELLAGETWTERAKE